MKRKKLRGSAHYQAIDQVEDEVANDNLHGTDLRQAETSAASADYYERCWKGRIEFHQPPWWIAIGVYLILISVAFAAL